MVQFLALNVTRRVQLLRIPVITFKITGVSLPTDGCILNTKAYHASNPVGLRRGNCRVHQFYKFIDHPCIRIVSPSLIFVDGDFCVFLFFVYDCQKI